MFYKIPYDILDGTVNQFELLPYVFAFRYKDYKGISVFTISTILKYFGIDEHHRKVSSMKDCIISLSENGILVFDSIDDLNSIDKNTLLICEVDTEFDKFVSLHETELDDISKAMSSSSNYNLLNVFCSIKSTSSSIGKNLEKNKFSTTDVGYRKITSMTGIKNGRTIKDAIDLLVDCGVVKVEQVTKNKRTKNIYSFYEFPIAK